MVQKTADQQAEGPGEHLLRELKWVHDAIRHDLAVCRALAEQVAAGAAPDHVREQIAALQTSSPLWKLRINCLYYCRFVHSHHHVEDVMFFPALRRSNPTLGPIVDKLEADHRTVSDLLDEVEAAADALAARDGADARARLVAALDTLAADLLAHLEFEERAVAPTVREWREWPR